MVRFKETYDALPKPIMKADACRALYMHFYGGALTLDLQGPLVTKHQVVPVVVKRMFGM